MFKQIIFGSLMSFALAVAVYAQDQSEFISLDCGSPAVSPYNETSTGITFISDANFISTGDSSRVAPELTFQLQQQMLHVRSFPKGLRNCYRLNLTGGHKYLIRASFVYGNYDKRNLLPEFDVHLGPDRWETVRIQNASSPKVLEVVHVLQSDYLYVCLVKKGSDTPFISALELRPLKNTTYVTQLGSLETFGRYDVASLENRPYSYRKDAHDRGWSPYNRDTWSRLSTQLPLDKRGSNDDKPPPLAMSTAGTPTHSSAAMEFFLEPKYSGTQFCVYMHFAEIQELRENVTRELIIALNGKRWFGPFQPKYLSTTSVHNAAALNGGEFNNFSIYSTLNSSLPPILNAFELYTVKEFLSPQTDQTDVDAITDIKARYGLERDDWQGDPCAPQVYMWHGLNCSYVPSNSPRIISLNLSSSGLSGDIAPYLSNLTMLEYLDLSNNKLRGSLPDFLSQLRALRVLNLQGNNLTGPVPPELIRRRDDGFLTLSVEGNPYLCSLVSCKEEKQNNLLTPLVSSVVGILVLLAITIITVWAVKKKKQKVVKVDRQSKSTHSSFESNKQFTYSEVLQMTNNFQRVLGRGGFGTVYYGCLNDTQVAVKVLSPSSVQGYKQFQAEVELLLRVHHRDLTSLVGYYDGEHGMALVYKYMANGNLREHLSDSSRNILSWEDRLQIAVEAAQGLEYLHHGCQPSILHRDVKSTNILLNDKFQAKLADFGLSRSFPVEGGTHVSTVPAGTPGYLDPEYYVLNRLTEKSDVYSFGVVLLELITGKPAISRISENERTHISQWVGSTIVNGDIKSVVDPRLSGDFDINSAWKATEIAMGCLCPTSSRRPTMNNVLMELNDCLATERTRRKKQTSDEFDHSTNSVEMVTVNLPSDLSPAAR